MGIIEGHYREEKKEVKQGLKRENIVENERGLKPEKSPFRFHREYRWLMRLFLPQLSKRRQGRSRKGIGRMSVSVVRT